MGKDVKAPKGLSHTRVERKHLCSQRGPGSCRTSNLREHNVQSHEPDCTEMEEESEDNCPLRKWPVQRSRGTAKGRPEGGGSGGRR